MVNSEFVSSNNSLVSPRSLLVRPSPQDGESWAGYLLRLSNKNGYEGIKKISTIIDCDTKLLLAFPQWERLKIIGIEINSHKSDSPDISDIQRFRAPFWTSVSTRSRACPQCLREMVVPHIMATWERIQLSACRVHSLLLIDQCDRCRRTITYSRKRWDACDCGRHYKDIVAPAMPRWFETFEHVLSIDELSKGVPSCGIAEKRTHPALVAQVLISLGNNLPIQRSGYPPQFGSQCQANDLAPWFSNWPRDFQVKLSHHLDMTSHKSRVNVRHWLKTKSFPELRKVVDEQSFKHSTPREMSRKLAIYTETHVVSPAKFGKLTGLGDGVVRNLIKGNFLPVTEGEPDRLGRPFRVVAIEHVHRVRKLHAETYSRKKAAQILKCPDSFLSALAKAKRLGVLYAFDSYPLPGLMRFRILDLERLLRSLDSGSTLSRSVTPDRINLTDLLSQIKIGYFHRGISVLKAIDRGNIKLYRSSSISSSFASYSLNRNQLTSFFDWWS